MYASYHQQQQQPQYQQQYQQQQTPQFVFTDEVFDKMITAMKTSYGMSPAEMQMTHREYLINVTAAEVYDALMSVQPSDRQEILNKPEVRAAARYVQLTLPKSFMYNIVKRETASHDLQDVPNLPARVIRYDGPKIILDEQVAVFDFSSAEALLQNDVDVKVYVPHPKYLGENRVNGTWEQVFSWLRRFERTDVLASDDQKFEAGSSGSMGEFAPDELGNAKAIYELLKGLSFAE